jgi:long-subunit fatty acid transport protein
MHSFSQNDDTKDLENWSSIRLKYKLNKKWSFELEEQLRLDEDISEVSGYFTQLSTEYTLMKNFKIGGALRFVRINDNEGKIQGYENHLRFHFDASYKHKINDVSLKYRLRYQNRYELAVDDYANQKLRLKVGIEYNIKNWKLDPKFSAEIFNQIGQEEENNGLKKYRLTLGTDYNLKNIGTIGLFYRIEQELNETIPKTINIIGLKYTYTIKNK